MSLTFVVALVVLAISLYLLWQYGERGLLLPGPKPHFLVGNLYDLPHGGLEWIKYLQLGKACGSDVVHLKFLGNSLLTLNSFSAANELLDKKGSVYSDRPRLVTLKELRGWDWNLVVMSYGRKFTTHRRLVQQYFQPSVVAESYSPLMRQATKILLVNLLDRPESFVEHLKNMAGGIILMLAYGHKIKPTGDEYVRLAETIRDSSVESVGEYWVDSLPILKYVPAWFPGAHFQRKALEQRKLATRLRTSPFLMVKAQVANGNAIPSIASKMLQSEFYTGGFNREELIMNCTGVIYAAGADTTVSALTTFLLAMVLYPEAQRKARAELDTHFELDRLPDFNDRKSLPYVDAVVKETLRWQPVAPLGVPHQTLKHDEFRGAHVPKGTVVLANIWAMLHDPDVYKDPYTFSPERFLPGKDGRVVEPDPVCAVFGFGRRICPGRYLADASVWIAIASILLLFDISKAKDQDGNEITPNVVYGSGLVSIPSRFSCSIIPRSSEAAKMINSLSLQESYAS